MGSISTAKIYQDLPRSSCSSCLAVLGPEVRGVSEWKVTRPLDLLHGAKYPYTESWRGQMPSQ